MCPSKKDNHQFADSILTVSWQFLASSEGKGEERKIFEETIPIPIPQSDKRNMNWVSVSPLQSSIIIVVTLHLFEWSVDSIENCLSERYSITQRKGNKYRRNNLLEDGKLSQASGVVIEKITQWNWEKREAVQLTPPVLMMKFISRKPFCNILV